MNTPIEWRNEELAQTLAQQQGQLNLLAAILGHGGQAAAGREERDTPWTIWAEDTDLSAPGLTAGSASGCAG